MYSGGVGREAVLAAFDRLDAAFDAVAGLSYDGLSAADALGLTARLQRQRCRQPAVEHRLLYEITSQVTPAELGAKNWADALVQRLAVSGTEARRRVAEAAELGPRRALTGQPLQPTLPTVAQRQADGAINTEHVTIIGRFFDELPDAVDYQTRQLCEETLANVAAEHHPGGLRKAAQRLAALVHPDGDLSESDRARRRYLRIGAQGADGLSRIEGLLDPQARATLDAVLAKLAAPGMCNPDDHTPCVAGPPPTAAAHRDTRSVGQRNHDGLTAAARTVLATTNLGHHNGLPTTIIVSTTLTELQSGTGQALTAGGTLLPMRDVIRLAAHAQHYLTVLDTHTQIPLYLGRSRRTATPGQRIALHATDRGCTFPGCTVPGYQCQAHHITEWAHGGHTDITNLTLACGPHNRLVSTHGWRTRKQPTGRTEWIPPPHLDRGQTRTNNYHHPTQYLTDPDTSTSTSTSTSTDTNEDKDTDTDTDTDTDEDTHHTNTGNTGNTDTAKPRSNTRRKP